MSLKKQLGTILFSTTVGVTATVQNTNVPATLTHSLTLQAGNRSNVAALGVHSGTLACRNFENIRYNCTYMGQRSFSSLHNNMILQRVNFRINEIMSSTYSIKSINRCSLIDVAYLIFNMKLKIKK